ncbi:NADH-quinone oxidoreductase subunit N [Rufibacter soli]
MMLQVLSLQPTAIRESILQTVTGLQALVPEMVLLSGFLLVLVLDLLPFPKLRRTLPGFTFVLFLVCLGWQILQIMGQVPFVKGYLFQDMLWQDGLALAGGFLFSVAALFSLLVLWTRSNLASDRNNTASEFYAVLLAVVLGLNLLVRSANLLMLFLSLELVSVGSYLLVFLWRNSARKTEAGLKYIMYGMFASGLMLYGISFLYGLSGSLQFLEPAFWQALSLKPPLILTVAWGLVLAGLLFKLAGFPFQFWAPDVYEAAPTGVVAFFSTAPKVAAALVLLRILAPQADTLLVSNTTLLWLLQSITVVTLVLGTFTALWQKNVKRLMGYSSVAHAGFLLLLLISGQPEAGRNMLFYATALLFGNLGFFLLIRVLEKAVGSVQLEDWGGVGRQSPWLGVVAAVFLLSLIGLPPTIGFMAKLLLFTQLWQAYEASGNVVWMVLLLGGLLLTVVSLFYYVRVLFFLFFKRNESLQKLVFPVAGYVFLPLLCVPVLLFFFKADWLQRAIEHVLSL